MKLKKLRMPALLGVMLVFALGTFAQTSPNTPSQAAIDAVVQNMQWTGQASVRILSEGKVIYIDPFNVTDSDSADWVFITHSHDDHLSVADLKKVVSSKTRVVAAAECEAMLRDNQFNVAHVAIPGQAFRADGIDVQVVPAYTITKNTHPKENNWVGYVLDFNGVKLYHPGDTQRIPEMKNIRCHIALMPLGQKYTMDTVDDAVAAILDLHPRVAIPFHYGLYEGTAADAQYFKTALTNHGGVSVVLIEKK